MIYNLFFNEISVRYSMCFYRFTNIDSMHYSYCNGKFNKKI